MPDPSVIYVEIGLGFHAQFTPSEALAFIDKRLALLEQHREKVSETIANVSSRMKIVLEGMRQLMDVTAGDEGKQRRSDIF